LAGLIFLGTTFSGLLAITGGCSLRPPRLAVVIAVVFVPFLMYASARFFLAEVWQDAEKSLMLHLTAFLLSVQIVFFMSERARKILLWTLAVNLCLIGIYGIVNHIFWGSARVLWVPGYDTYLREHRATGSYFCPDHFAGAMEILMAVSLGFALSRDSGRTARLAGSAMAVIALAAVFLSKSRGGGLTVLMMGAAALAWGFHQWPRRIRMWWRVIGVAAAGLALVLVVLCVRSYVDRFVSYWQCGEEDVRLAGLARAWRESCRGRMYGAALRAWRTSPVWGIGPGMHQNLWPHFAATEDGDREGGVWPSMPNYDFHSYEVHSDWLQLLEEHGIAGMILFLPAVVACFAFLLRGLRCESLLWEKSEWRGPGTGCCAAILGSLLAGVAMAFHSLGDFNLQIPANTWLLSSVAACGVACACRAAHQMECRQCRPAVECRTRRDT